MQTQLSPEVFLHIFHFLHIHELSRIMEVNTGLRSLARFAIRHRLYRFLQSYGLPPAFLTETMAATGAVIGGPSTLAFVTGAYTSERWLGLWVCRSGARHLEQALFQILGVSASTRHTMNVPGVTLSNCPELLVLSRTAQGDDAQTAGVLVVVLPDAEGLVSPMTCNLSTATMAYITSESLVVVYPRLTFSGRALWNRALPFHTFWSTITTQFRTLHPPLQAHREVLSSLEIDVRPWFNWPGPCGNSCPATQASRNTASATMEDVFCLSLHDTQLGQEENARGRHVALVQMYRSQMAASCMNLRCPHVEYGDFL